MHKNAITTKKTIASIRRTVDQEIEPILTGKNGKVSGDF